MKTPQLFIAAFFYFVTNTYVMVRKILIGLLILLVVIKFIRPERNIAKAASPNDIAAVYPVPQNIRQMLQKSCYDCHSNNTEYPWYTNIQPVGLWLQHHVDEGKEHLNFSEFGAYSKKKQAHKLEETAEMVEDGEMPLDSYLIMHGEARLSEEQTKTLITWAEGLFQRIEGETL